MQDTEIFQRISALVEEEHALMQRGENELLSPVEQERIDSLQIALDQCWDLLRQRRARREFGLNPDEARQRDPDTIERYQQ